MSLRTRVERGNLAANVAADTFKWFSQKKHRSPQWALSDVESIIASQTTIQAFGYAIDERHHKQMVSDAIEFYTRHLKDALALIVELENRGHDGTD